MDLEIRNHSPSGGFGSSAADRHWVPLQNKLLVKQGWVITENPTPAGDRIKLKIDENKFNDIQYEHRDKNLSPTGVKGKFLLSIGNKINGKKEGIYIEMNNSRRYISDYIEYNNGLREGLSVKFGKCGHITESHYSKGELNGIYRNIVPCLGNRRQDYGSYLNGKKEGKWTSFHDDGQIASEMFYKNGIIEDGPYTSYYDNGNKSAEGSILKNVPHGKWTTFHENGQIESKAFYKNGHKDGPYTEYYDNGNKSLERSVVNGIKKKIEYHENGCKKLDEETYDDGGRCLKHYDDNGQHYRTINYNKDSRKNGPYINYGKNGNKILEASYLNDKEHGKWIYYSDDGKILKEEIKNTN